jgi:hypothetical protein
MIDPRRSVPILVTLILTLAACSGSGTSTSAAASAPAATTAPSDAGSGAHAGGTPGTEASAEAAVTEPPAGGGGTAADVCGLVTADELASIFGVSGVKQTVLPGPPDNCIVDSDTGDALTAWSLTTAQSATIFGAMTTDPSTVAVPGVGDKAAFVQNTGLLVLKGNSLISVAISGGSDMSDDEVIEASKQIGALAAGRL